MSPEVWASIKRIFDGAVEGDPAERSAYLDAHCDGDLDMRSEVESLLAAYDGAGTFIEEPVLGSDLPLANGSSLGPFRIVQVLGQGGMGMVYQAVRTDDIYRKLVAIKVARKEFGSDFALRRFELERQILAHLDHPNIARLLDGGATPDGRPYFVMEFIAGLPIDAYCDEQRLTIPDRLRFFLPVCAAVHYAHQNLVIHRDLKPENILITPEGTVKLLDFGIAKLVDPDSQGATPTLVLVMTPECASPEQLRGAPVTTASDVYALGLLLYRLLTGDRPYHFETRSPEAIWEAIRSTEPPKPSTVLTAAAAEQRATSLDRARRQLTGDVDNILLKALQVDPARRYASAEQFSMDIERHLSGMPVLARQDTIRYRAMKFARRHTTGVAAAAIFLVMLIGAVLLTSWQAHIANQQRALAERRFQDLHGLARDVIFELHDAIAQLPGSTSARELLVSKAQRYLDQLAEEDSAGDEALQHERAMAQQRIGDVQGLTSQPNLGKTAAALASYRKALALQEGLVRRNPERTDLRGELAGIENRICSLGQNVGEFDQALAACQRAVAIGEDLVRYSPGDQRLRAELGGSYQQLAGAYSSLGDWARTNDCRQKALTIFEALHAASPADENFQYQLAIAYHRLSGFEEQRKNYLPAKTHALRSIALFDEIAAKHPGRIKPKVDATFALQRLGSVQLTTGDLQGALRSFERVLPVRLQVLQMDPRDARARVSVCNTHAAIGVVLMQLGDTGGALRQFAEQVRLAELLIAEDGMRIEHRLSKSEGLENTGRTLLLLAERASAPDAGLRYRREARAKLQQAIGIYDELRGRNAIPGEFAAVPDRIRGELAECERGLQARSASSR